MVCYFTKGGRGLPTCSLRLRTTSQVHGYGRQFRCGRFLLFYTRVWSATSLVELFASRSVRATLRPKLEYRLGAAEFISIVNGLGDYMREYATQVQADEQEIAPLFCSNRCVR